MRTNGHSPKFVIWIFWEPMGIYAWADKRQVFIPHSKNRPTLVLTPNQYLAVTWLVNNLRLWFFTNSEIKELPILVFLKPFKQPLVFMKQMENSWQFNWRLFDEFLFLESCGYISDLAILIFGELGLYILK